LRTNARVTAIDRTARRVTLHDGGKLTYGTLVIATGCSARVLPAQVDAGAPVFVLRSLADAVALRPRLVPGARVVAVGAGFIGLEIAATARALGCTVTVVEKASHALGRVMDPGVARALVDLHRAQGVDFRFGTGVAAVRGGATGARLTLDDGSVLDADTVVAGVGAAPRTEIAEAAGLDCDDGILTDAFGRTSDPAIWAAGDVTRQDNPLLGRAVRLESWQNAQSQGIAVGRALAGDAVALAEVPWFWTDQYDVNLQMAGVPRRWDRVIWRGSPADGKFTAIYLDGGRVVAGNTWNAARDMRPIRQLIQSGADVSGIGLDDMGQSLTAICKTLGAA
jgi:3-phenylpropionate/trans-cinnamate dioxygenase ferredoxin reductase subunit